MDKTAILIKSYYQDLAIANCINSIERFFPAIPYKIYIADDSPISPKKELLYARLLSMGHMVAKLPENTGVSKSRNILLDCLEDEKYVLRLDDDFELCSETNILSMMDVLSRDNNIGAVADLERQIGTGKGCFSGDINPWQGFLTIDGNKLVKNMVLLDEFQYQVTPNGTEYAICDLTRNMILFKREIFSSISWDNNLMFDGEHEDLMLQIKESGWQLTFTRNSVHLHRDDLKSEDNNYLRSKRISDQPSWRSVYQKKWGVNKIILKRPFKQLVKAGFVKLIKGLIRSI